MLKLYINNFCDGIFYILPIYQTPLSETRFHEFRSMGERSQRETIATGTSPTKNHLTRTTEGRPHSGMRRVGGAWEAERERERKKKHFPRACSISSELFSRGVIRFWSIEVASFFRSSDGKCVSADPDPGRRGGTKRRGKNGETLHPPTDGTSNG